MIIRVLVQVLNRPLLEQYDGTMALSTFVPERKQPVGGMMAVVMANGLAPLPRSEGRARREPFGGVCSGSAGSCGTIRQLA
jgi:hypothetical protein